MSGEDLITAISKAATSKKERNQVFGNKKQLKVYGVGSDETCNSAGKCDNKVDKLVSALELLTKQVSTLKSEINNIKCDGYKKNISDDFNSGDRRGRIVISCKNCKENNRTTCNHCFKCGWSNHLARGCRNPSSGNQGNRKRLLVLGNQQPKRLCPKGVIVVKNYNLRNVIVLVLVNMFISMGESASLGPGRTTKLCVHL